MATVRLHRDRPVRGRLRHVAAETPYVVGAFLAGTVAMGYGVAHPIIDAVGLAATGTGYAVTRGAIEALGARRGRSGRELG